MNRLLSAGTAFAAAASLLAVPGAAAADSPPTLTGALTDAYLWSYVTYDGRTGDDGVAIIARSHQEEGGLDTPTGWYMLEGTTTAQVLWGASTSAPSGTSANCTHSISVGAAVLYQGVPTRALATWINPWIDFDFLDLRRGVTVAGPQLADLTKSPGRHSASAMIDCGDFGTARWITPIVVLPRPDPERPTGVSIEDGADFTNSKRVRLWLGWEGLVDKVRLSNDGGFAPSRTKEIALDQRGALDWTLVELAAERIPRQVYVKFHSVEQGWLRQTYSDDIILDTVRPEILSASIDSGGSVSQLTASKRPLRVRAKDNKSGVAQAQIAAGKPRTTARVVTFGKRLSAPTRGAVFVRVRDGAGNWSKWTRAR
ncbi:MAG: hypothetical protein V9G10_17845 [Candidatus Nanopelagicales bacterium]